MSRRREFEIMFGSDSFLDVVANIVGILIILIVIAGVRVSQAPPKPKSGIISPVPILELPGDSVPPQVSPPSELQSIAPEPILADVAPDADAPIAPLPALVPPPDLVGRVQDLEAEIASLSLESQKLGDSLATSNRQQSDLDLRLQAARGLLEQRKGQLHTAVTQNDQQKYELNLLKQAIARTLAQVTELEAQSPPTEKLEHRINPVSRTVQGRELHFRLDKNRVSEVPMDALVERLKEHLERRRDWIAKTRQHKGQVGPVNGFNLEFMIGVESMTGMGGYGGYQTMSLRYWEIHPEATHRGETEELALSQGSRFYEALLNASTDTTLTFWVYPDSYGLYRKLQRFAHEHGFPVAARPLPNGLAISGSPNGTKSASQ